jgi:hypothetical protein
MSNPVHRTRARNMSLHLLVLLVEATLILTPQPMQALGGEIVVVNLIGLQLPLRFIYKAFYRDRHLGERGAYSIYRGAANVSAYLFGLGGGVCLILASVWGMYLITASFIVFLVSAILNAWTIMTVVGESKKRSET